MAPLRRTSAGGIDRSPIRGAEQTRPYSRPGRHPPGLGLQRGVDRDPQAGPPPAQYRSPLGRRPYDLRHAAVSLWLNSGVPATEVAPQGRHGVAVLLKIYAHCIDGQADAANKRITDALGVQDTQPESGDEGDDDNAQHPEMPGQRNKAGWAVGVTAPTAPVRGFFWPRPWTKPGAHGRIADGAVPRSCLERRMCWSAECSLG